MLWVIEMPHDWYFNVHHDLVAQALDVWKEDRFVLNFGKVLDFALIFARVGLLLAFLLLSFLIPLFHWWMIWALFHLSVFLFLRFGVLLGIPAHDFAYFDEFAQSCENESSHVGVVASIVSLACTLLI